MWRLRIRKVIAIYVVYTCFTIRVYFNAYEEGWKALQILDYLWITWDNLCSNCEEKESQNQPYIRRWLISGLCHLVIQVIFASQYFFLTYTFNFRSNPHSLEAIPTIMSPSSISSTLYPSVLETSLIKPLRSRDRRSIMHSFFDMLAYSIGQNMIYLSNLSTGCGMRLEPASCCVL